MCIGCINVLLYTETTIHIFQIRTFCIWKKKTSRFHTGGPELRLEPRTNWEADTNYPANHPPSCQSCHPININNNNNNWDIGWFLESNLTYDYMVHDGNISHIRICHLEPNGTVELSSPLTSGYIKYMIQFLFQSSHQTAKDAKYF